MAAFLHHLIACFGRLAMVEVNPLAGTVGQVGREGQPYSARSWCARRQRSVEQGHIALLYAVGGKLPLQVVIGR